MNPDFNIRLATPEDAGAIAAIYNQGIDDRVATFETAHRTAGDIRHRIGEKGDRFPTIVVVDDHQVIAWSSAGPYRDRPCYSGVAEHSVYVHRAARGRGAGRLALTGLIEAYAQRGFWKLLSRIFPENQASIKLHQSLGFRIVGVYEKHAQLDGAWRDVAIVERLLGIADKRESPA